MRRSARPGWSVPLVAAALIAACGARSAAQEAPVSLAGVIEAVE